jgi:hypothetical protein
MNIKAASLLACVFFGLSAPASSTTVELSGLAVGLMTMDYTFTLGPTVDTFTVNSVTVNDTADQSSGYYHLLPLTSTFTGFAPLVAPACETGNCLFVFGTSNAGEQAGYNPYPLWAWFGNQQAFGTNSTGATLGTFDVAFFANGADVTIAPFQQAFSLLLPPPNTDATTGIDFTPGVPEFSTWAMLLIGFAGIGFAGYWKSQRLIARTPLQS